MNNNKINTTEKEIVAYHAYLTYVKEHYYLYKRNLFNYEIKIRQN